MGIILGEYCAWIKPWCKDWIKMQSIFPWCKMLYLEYVLGTHYILVVQSIKWKKNCHIECNMFAMGIEGCQVPKLCKKYFINCKPGNYLNSVEQDQKLIMPGESMMHVSIKPDANLMSDLSQNVRHPQKCNRQMDVPHPNILGWPQKTLSEQCRKSQWGDNMILWSYYLHQRILHTGTRVSIAKPFTICCRMGCVMLLLTANKRCPDWALCSGDKAHN